jgi:hypothetical protein
MSQAMASVRPWLSQWVSAPRSRLRIVLALAVLALPIAACDGNGRDASTSKGRLAEPVQASPWTSAEVRGKAFPWASSQVRGQAFGALWRQGTHDKRDLERSIDAYKWAIRTCQAVIVDHQTPETMVRQVEAAGFTGPGARMVVTAALRGMCPEYRQATNTTPTVTATP